MFQAVETARAAGVTVSVDVNYRAKLWSRYDAAPVLRDLVSRADVVFAGPDEAALVLGTTDAPAAGLAALGPTEVVIKDGQLKIKTSKEITIDVGGPGTLHGDDSIQI